MLLLVCNESWISLAWAILFGIHFTAYQSARVSVIMCLTSRGGHSIVKKYREGAGSIVWGLGFWLEKDIFKNIDLGNS